MLTQPVDDNNRATCSDTTILREGRRKWCYCCCSRMSHLWLSQMCGEPRLRSWNMHLLMGIQLSRRGGGGRVKS